MNTVLEVRNLCKIFGGGRTFLSKPKPSVHAVQSVSFSVADGEVLGIVGESGCGKTTLARMLVGLLPASSGQIRIAGKEIADLTGDADGSGRHIQYVFQDALGSLNPRKTIGQIVEAPLIHLLGMAEAERKTRIDELLDAVNLRREFLRCYPHELSGGQAQRIGIARALAANARIIVLDEPVSSLDVSVQTQVLNLLAGLREVYNLTYLFISHDLAVVEAISARTAVLYFGSLVELGNTRDVLASPCHPYTRLLTASAPVIGKPPVAVTDRIEELPDPLNPPAGCAFAERCDRAQDDCRRDKSSLINIHGEHYVRCFHPIEKN